MAALALAYPTRTVPLMARESVDAPEAKLLGRALGVLRKRAELSQETAGDRYGISGEGWRKYEAGMAKAIFSPDTQTRLTNALGFVRQDLLDERARLNGEDLPGVPRIGPAERQSWVQARGPITNEPLGILDTIQAGVWVEMDDVGQVAPPPSNVLPDPRYPRARQYISVVRGDSMNALGIVEGDWVHWVDAADIGYVPKSGDIVRAERLRFGGHEREATLKQVEVTGPDAALLWPRSTNPRFKSPLELTAGTSEGEDIVVQVTGLILSTIRRF